MLAAMITLQQVSRVTGQSRVMGHESACQEIDGRQEARLHVDGHTCGCVQCGGRRKNASGQRSFGVSGDTNARVFRCEGEKNY